jgi:nitroreductase
MEFSGATPQARHGPSVRPDRPVPVEVIDTALRNAIRAQSAGFNQGWDFVVLCAGQLTGRATSTFVPCDVVLEESAHAASFLKVIQANEVLLSASADTVGIPQPHRENSLRSPRGLSPCGTAKGRGRTAPDQRHFASGRPARVPVGHPHRRGLTGLPDRSLNCFGVVPQHHVRLPNICSRRSIKGC